MATAGSAGFAPQAGPSNGGTPKHRASPVAARRRT
uniref:Uncharacterized protein n=1 Tax=Setaria italica TaxID=4555 RepID=K3Y4D8_SETIT